MSDQSQSWQSYEQVAVEIMNKIAAMLGLESVEGKQSVYGSRTGTDWEIDGKGVKVGGESFVIIECRRYSKQKQKQEQVGALAYRIRDTGASGAILVSPLGFQEGAKKVAAAENIQEFIMGPDSTSDAFVVSFLNNVVIGAPTAHATATALPPKVVTEPSAH
jgi:Restriction endonuclease